MNSLLVSGKRLLLAPLRISQEPNHEVMSLHSTRRISLTHPQPIVEIELDEFSQILTLPSTHAFYTPTPYFLPITSDSISLSCEALEGFRSDAQLFHEELDLIGPVEHPCSKSTESNTSSFLSKEVGLFTSGEFC